MTPSSSVRANAVGRWAQPPRPLDQVVQRAARQRRRRAGVPTAARLVCGVLLPSAAGIHLPRDAISGYPDLYADSQRYCHVHVLYRP